MGCHGPRLTFSVSCLVLVWAAGSDSVKVLHQPTCSSDYISTSTCEWGLDGPTNCSAELRLTYQLNFPHSENLTCVPENRESAVCLCDMLTEDVTTGDTYQLDLWAGKQLLWSGSFKLSEHVKPRAPRNLMVVANISHMCQLSWSNPYPPKSYLHSKLSYMVNISSEDNPTEFIVYNVTYKEPTLHFPASTLKVGTFYSARVRARAQEYKSTWSEWSPSVRWLNYYKQPWEQHLPLAISISCLIIPVICLSCYFSVIKIKEWWDHIPSPAHSHLVAIVIQESQVSLSGKRSGGQDPAKSPRWKTCLTKLLPCLLEHGMEKDGDSSKAATRNVPLHGPGGSPWGPVEVSKMVLCPESISVVKCVELLEAQVEKEEEEEEAEKGSFYPSPESSGGGFQEGREGIAARLTESLFLDLLGGETWGFCPQRLGESGLLPPSDSRSAPQPWAELSAEEPREASFQGRGQPLTPESTPAATRTRSPACQALTATPAVITDNPSYRSFGSSLSQSAGPEELHSDPPLAGDLGEGDPNILSAPQPSEPPPALQPEPETWEQVLRQSLLQHGAAAAPTGAPASGYREFVHAVQQGSAQGGASGGFGLSGEAGYKAFSSLLAGGAICPGTSGDEASSGEGCYRPFQSLTSGPTGLPAPVPLFTFGLDMEPPHSPRNSLLPSGFPECPGLEPVAKGQNNQKPPLSLEQATDPLGDDLGSGSVYSALTCHLCGHLKQRHGQEEPGEASPCCGCRCGDRSEPPVSPLWAPDALPGGVPLDTSLPPASLTPLGVSKEGKSPPFFQPDPSNAPSSSQTPKVAAMLSALPACTSAS